MFLWGILKGFLRLKPFGCYYPDLALFIVHLHSFLPLPLHLHSAVFSKV